MSRKQYVVAGVIAVATISIFFLIFSRFETGKNNTPERIVFTPEFIMKTLPQTVMEIPDGSKNIQVSIDTYQIGNAVTIGGSFESNTDQVTVFVPESFSNTAKGSLVYDVSGDDGRFVLVPVYINFGGTGTFLMIALFSYDAVVNKFVHKDLYFIDDRVPFLGFSSGDNGVAVINYRTRREGDSMASEPLEDISRSITRLGTKIVLVQ